MRNNIKKQSRKRIDIFLIIIIVLLICTVLGISYAWYQVTQTTDNALNLVSGNLNVSYASTGSLVNLENAEPISDYEGLQGSGYSFSITNNSSVNSRYIIYLDDEAVTGTRMSDNYVKYVLTMDSTNTISTLDQVTSTTDSETGLKSRTLIDSVIPAGETFNYTLKVWMSSESDNTQMNTIFKAKLKVVNTQVTDE